MKIGEKIEKMILILDNKNTQDKMGYKEDLEEKGYCVIKNVLSTEEVTEARKYFDDWYYSHPQIKEIGDKINPHGIFKHFNIGQQRHAWYIRTRPNVQTVFANIWDTDDLVVSFDGTCYIPANCKKKDNIWTHTDQAPSKRGRRCIQGFVAITSNTYRSLIVYEGTHKLHEQYAKDHNLTSSKDWLLIDHDYLKKIKELRRILYVEAGSLVLWDSRTFHQNQYGGNCNEERIVQYVCFLPRKDLTEKQQEKRIQYFLDDRTTSHWPYPVKVNGLQPQSYGNKNLIIKYEELEPADLEDLIDDINRIL